MTGSYETHKDCGVGFHLLFINAGHQAVTTCLREGGLLADLRNTFPDLTDALRL